MTIKISELGNLLAVYGNTIVPVVANVAGTLTTVKGNLDQLTTYIISGPVQSNVIMKDYVDGQIVAANTASATANVGMIGYVDNSVLTANLGIIGYIDSVATLSSYSNVNVIAYTETVGFTNYSNVNVAAYLTTGSFATTTDITTANIGQIGYTDNAVTTANIGIIGYVNESNIGQIGYTDNAVTTANIGMIGYVDDAVLTANIGMLGYVGAVIDAVTVANTVVTESIVTANIGMLGYVDNQTYSNVQVATYLPTYSGDVAFTMANVAHWTSNVTTISDAINQLAERVYNIENP